MTRIYPAVRTGSRNTRFFFTPPSGRGLVIPVFFTPPSGRGLVIPVFYPAVRMGSSNTRFFFTTPSGRGLVIAVFFFVVVTCPRPPRALKLA